LAWFDLSRFDKPRERSSGYVDATADHNVLKLTRPNEMSDLSLGNIDPERKLLWRL
jgi:hypothetical protein